MIVLLISSVHSKKGLLTHIKAYIHAKILITRGASSAVGYTTHIRLLCKIIGVGMAVHFVHPP